MTVQLLTEQHLEFPSLTGGCTGSSESTLVKMPLSWKSHVAAHCALIEMLLFRPACPGTMSKMSVIIMHQSFVSTAPQPTGMGGDSAPSLFRDGFHNQY